MAKEKQRQEKMGVMMSNTDYINWLINFTKVNGDFSDEDWLYSKEKLNEIDQENVDNLSLFFEGIFAYAKNNYIYSYRRPLGECYRIKIDDIGFEIGYISGQGTKFYCQRIPVEEDFLDFMDIVNKKIPDNVFYIRNNLDNLSYQLIYMYKNGVPPEAIINTFNKTMHYIEKNKQEKNKVKKKML
jgi:hypothetical protein